MWTDTLTMLGMAAKRKKSTRPADIKDRRVTPTVMVRIPEELVSGLTAKAKADYTDRTKVVIKYIIEGLRRDGYLEPERPPLKETSDG